jgi:hypothetical protein
MVCDPEALVCKPTLSPYWCGLRGIVCDPANPFKLQGHTADNVSNLFVTPKPSWSRATRLVTTLECAYPEPLPGSPLSHKGLGPLLCDPPKPSQNQAEGALQLVAKVLN